MVLVITFTITSPFFCTSLQLFASAANQTHIFATACVHIVIMLHCATTTTAILKVCKASNLESIFVKKVRENCRLQ